jgi:hypothetical protein
LGLGLKHTFLFPFCDEVEPAQEYYKRIHKGLMAADIAAEYEEQILQVGLIKCKKVNLIRQAAKWFQAELIFLVLGAAAFMVQVLTFPR